jgi:hypothetical protein
VGERLSAPLRLVDRPVGRCVGGRRLPSPSSPSNRVPSACDPSRSRGQKGGGSTKLLAPPASASHGFGAPLGPTPFQCRGCGLLVVFLTPRGAFTDPCRPLAFVVICRHARVGSSARCADLHTLLAKGVLDLTCKPRTLLRPAGESRTGRSPETPFVVS